ncbi:MULTISPECIES: VWA domain-containing protein [Rhodopseudomonas]|uniref:von Willebrand factor A n=1 Tax=Rhodopseudomonas palustris TaxID=1076 RepID=A0A0D7E0C7_RHOPL|nr:MULTISPECIES: VWA domain-containing protein [Rhodopseudomonas]KIZ33122.1 von Willebrand factor A [Rhodopseudomonas palustris]MDF3809847.1 VWA domain-containing protein [Rhodopseudomonas sp. BAL398]WOK20144.1 VWA domain-containing protein [Rhodopseudomonas sp. BAL398]
MTDIDHLNPPTGQMADNVIGFARALRAAGLPVGPGAVIDALNAIQLIEIGNRADLFATLQAVFVKRHEHALIFAQAFDLFFRAAEDWKHMLDSIPLPDHAKKKPKPASRRVQEALSQPAVQDVPAAQEQELRLSVSDKEILQKKDFAQMSAAEIAQVTRAIANMRLPQAELRTRRFQPDPRGLKLDLRRTLRGSLRTGGDIVDIRRLGLIDKPAPIVALLDISGSMSEYTRLFLHFLHAITDARKRVSVFLFGTRLTNVTRALRARDPDEALASCTSAVEDWAGGTRISASLHAFNKQWARRVLGQGAIVLLISDGLEREADGKLAFEMDRLHRSCRRLIWLNPLLRFGGFEARAQGIKMMLPHVDEFRPVHNLTSMAALIAALSSVPPPHHFSAIRPAA